MNKRKTIPFASELAGILLVILPGVLLAQDSGIVSHSSGEIKAAIQRAIQPIEVAMVGYREKRRCFSCHHHAHAIIALTEMSRRGLEVDRENLQFQFVRSVDRTKSVMQRYQKNQNIGGGIDTTGHALLAMRIGGHEPDETTKAMLHWILDRDSEKGFWTGTRNRPPTQTSDLTRTWLCLDALEHFGTDELEDEINNRKGLVRKWLLAAETITTEDKVSRIRALSLLGETTEVEEFGKELVAKQRVDGGWAQEEDMQSDAYATGSVLMTLHQNAGYATTEEFYVRGIAFLKSAQLDDGTWHVKTRATRVQEYFESGFPHGRDQYISFTATCWAATAMSFAIPVTDSGHAIQSTHLSNSMMHLSDNDQPNFRDRFEKEVWPLIDGNGKSSCIRCHRENHRSSFRLTGDLDSDFEMMVNRGFLHPDDPGGILFPIQSDNQSLMMPPAKHARLNEKQIDTLKRFSEELYQAKK